MLGDTRFNFAGCSASDLVSHYIPAMTMLCVFAVRRTASAHMELLAPPWQWLYHCSSAGLAGNMIQHTKR